MSEYLDRLRRERAAADAHLSQIIASGASVDEQQDAAEHLDELDQAIREAEGEALTGDGSPRP